MSGGSGAAENIFHTYQPLILSGNIKFTAAKLPLLEAIYIFDISI